MGYIVYNVLHGSTLVADESATHLRNNGRTRTAISDDRLRSGITPENYDELLQRMDRYMEEFEVSGVDHLTLDT